MDAVRVRPYHEEMTTTLLEEVEKQIVHQKEHSSSRGSTGIAGSTGARDSVGSGANDTPVAATAATSAAAVGSRVANSTYKKAPTAGTTTRRSCVTPGPLPNAYQGAHGQSRNAGSVAGENRNTALASDTPSESPQSAVGHRAGATAVVRQGLEAERMSAALATIEQLRTHTAPGPSVAPHDLTGLHPFGRPDGTRLSLSVAMSAAREATPARNAAGKSKLSEAFSPQSVRWGATLGYYGREEVDALFAISKNPSRVAAYNRIIEGKDGGREGENVNPEVQTKRERQFDWVEVIVYLCTFGFVLMQGLGQGCSGQAETGKHESPVRIR